MCGRYSATKNPARLAEEFDALDATPGDGPGPDHNVAPTKQVLSVVTRHPRDEAGTADQTSTERSIRVMRWGLVPNWAKDPGIGARMINARADSAGTKPAFRTSLARRRCLLPADGWYEWQVVGTGKGKHKQPYFTTSKDGSSLALAGLWSVWRAKDAPPDEPPLITCAVLTTDAVGPLREIHDRMPLLLPPEAWQRWLDPDGDVVADLLVPPSRDLVDGLELRPVSTKVNNVRNNGEELTERVDPEQAPAARDAGHEQPTLL